MANIEFFERNLTKDVWHIVYDGTNNAAFTLISILNRTTDNCNFVLAFGTADLAQGQSAVDGSGYWLETNTKSFMWQGELVPNDNLYFDTAQGGKILIKPGTKFAIAISGDGNLEVNISGMEL